MGCVCLFGWSRVATWDTLPTVHSVVDTTQKCWLENHPQRLRISNLHVIQMVISFLKEHAVITNTICILFSPSRTFFTVFFQIWRISARNHFNLFSCQVKGGTSWDWGHNLSSKNKYPLAIILEKKLLRKLTIHNTAPFFANTRTIFVAASHICWFTLLSFCL